MIGQRKLREHRRIPSNTALDAGIPDQGLHFLIRVSSPFNRERRIRKTPAWRMTEITNCRRDIQQRLTTPFARFDCTHHGCYDQNAGWSSLVARWAHNPKVGGSNPPPATNFFNQLQPFGPERSAHFSLILPAIARQPARARPVFGHSRLGCICSLSWRCWNAARVPAAPSHRCGSHVAGKNTSAGTYASPQS